jgi:hypothetical protein
MDLKVGLLILAVIIGYRVYQEIRGRFYWKRFHKHRETFQHAERDISQLGDDDEEGGDDVITEKIEVDGGPLKEGHRRRALRDRRLLPKPKPNLRVWPRPKKPRVMDMDEATRLFSGSLRTRNRTQRDLRIDEDQVKRYGLPPWRNEQDVAEALDLSVGELRHFAMHREKERAPHYVRFAIPKRSGGERIIMAPKRRLKAVQRRLNEVLLAKLPVSDAAHGFRAGRSVATHARPHVGRKVVVKLDIKDFFPSLHVGRVRGLLIAYGYSYPVAATIALLVTEADRQPVEVDGTIFHAPVGSRYAVQGAPTSPAIANALALTLDHRLAGLARKFGFAYTRYADDLTFSGDDVAQSRALVKAVQRIVFDEGFRINDAKTRVMTQRGAQRVTGVIVNREMGLSRQERRRLRAALHRQAMNPDPKAGKVLDGKLAYLSMLNPRQAERLSS